MVTVSSIWAGCFFDMFGLPGLSFSHLFLENYAAGIPDFQQDRVMFYGSALLIEA